jgi:predicted phage gp36 major capsid-like protein
MTAESVIAKIEAAGGVFRLTPRGVAVTGVSFSLRSEAKPYRSAIEKILRERVQAARLKLDALAECWRIDCLAYSVGDDSRYARMGPTSARASDLVALLMALDPDGGYLAVKVRMREQAAAAATPQAAAKCATVWPCYASPLYRPLAAGFFPRRSKAGKVGVCPDASP